MNLGDRIRKAREDMGLSQGNLAQLIGVKSGAVISNWEKGLNKPDAEKLVSLCEALHVTASYLLDFYGKTSDPEQQAERRTTPKELRLLSTYRQLHSEGQDKLLSYADDLLSTGKYIKNTPMANEA